MHRNRTRCSLYSDLRVACRSSAVGEAHLPTDAGESGGSTASRVNATGALPNGNHLAFRAKVDMG